MTLHRAKLFLLLVLLPFVTAAPLSALASGWVEADSPTSRNLFGIDLYGDAIYAVGERGTVAYSDDEGDSFDLGDSNVDEDLYDVSAISESKAIAVGENGTLIRTTDGGESWRSAAVSYDSSSHADIALRTVLMASATVGYAAGGNGLLLKTTEAGSDWEEIDSPTGEAINDIAATSASKLWIAGEGGVIYATTNGGTSWSTQTSGTGYDLVSIEFTSSTVGWASGGHRTFLRTTDGGSVWKSVTISELESDDVIDDIAFSNSSDGILSTTQGVVLETDDGGLTWDEVDTEVSSPVLIDLYAASATDRWGVGEDGIILRFDSDSPTKPSSFDVEGDNDSVGDTTPTFTWNASTDDASVEAYYFKIDTGSYKNVGDETSATASSSLSDGEHTAYVYAVDGAGNASAVASLSFVIDGDSTSSGAPDVSEVTPTTAVKGETVTFSVRVSGNDDIDSCVLYVDGSAKTMTLKTDVAYVATSFSSSGDREMYARCTDDSGRKTSGSEVTVTVSATSAYASPGDIIKIGCEGNVYVNDPCTAVYYYGKDGKRHAFPNEYAFKTWFSDFDDLVTLSASAMANIPLGRNVVIRPGEVLVKFSTNTVYATSYLGVLRPIVSEGIAKSLFGSNWASLVTIVNDVFYSNYRIGSDIESSADHSASAVRSVTSSIDATF